MKTLKNFSLWCWWIPFLIHLGWLSVLPMLILAVLLSMSCLRWNVLLPSNSLPVLVKWIKLVRRSLLSAMRTTKCWRSILSIKRVMLGLSLKVALHSSCCVTPSFSHRKRRTVHCSGVISTPFWRKFRLSFRLMAADTLPFNMAILIGYQN